jgi:hypothetical protein
VYPPKVLCLHVHADEALPMSLCRVLGVSGVDIIQAFPAHHCFGTISFPQGWSSDSAHFTKPTTLAQREQ